MEEPARFDWWLLVVVPALVSIAVYYIQKIIDRAGIRSFDWLNRYILRKKIADTLATLTAIADETFIVRYARYQNSFLALGITTITYLIVNVLIDYQSGPASGIGGGKFISIGLGLINTIIIIMFMVVYRDLIRYNSMYCDPVKHVADLEKRTTKIRPNDFEQQISKMKIISSRIEAARMTRLQNFCR